MCVWPLELELQTVMNTVPQLNHIGTRWGPKSAKAASALCLLSHLYSLL